MPFKFLVGQIYLSLPTALQLAALATGLVTGKGVESLQTDMHRAKVPWLELHAPGGIQVGLCTQSAVATACTSGSALSQT